MEEVESESISKPQEDHKVVFFHFVQVQVDREYTVQRALHSVGFPVPHPLLYCTDTRVIGTDFYIMEHVQVSILMTTIFFYNQIDVVIFKVTQSYVMPKISQRCVKRRNNYVL